MIDLHSHVLHGLDDGAPDEETSLEMLRVAAADGVRVLMATPHQLHPAGYHVDRDRAERRLREVRAAAAREELDVELLGAEIHFSEELVNGLKDGSLLGIGEKGRYFLLELPVTTIPFNLKDVVFECQTAGFFPILAHPERNFEIVSRPRLAKELRERGVLLQLTAQSITGAFGKKSEKAARRLLKWGVVDLIASDAHNAVRRPPRLKDAVTRAGRWIGREAARRMVTDTPARILAGEVLE